MGKGSHGFHSHDDHGHSHSDKNQHNHSHHSHKCACSKTFRLSTMLVMTFSFFLAELVVGHKTHSLTLIADSFHMLSDVIALCIGLFAVRIAKKKSSKNTFGWVRAEVLGALVNSVFLVSLCLSIVIEAVERIVKVEKIENVELLLYVATAGLIINLIGLVIFGHGHSHGVPAEAVKKLEELEEDDDDDDDEFNKNNFELIKTNNENNNVESINRSKTSLNNNNNIKKEKHGYEAEVNKSLVEKKPVNGTRIDNIEAKDVKKERQCCSILSSQANLNIRAVFLHVLADALGSVVVIISGLLNKFGHKINIKQNVLNYIDPSLSLILVALILTSTIPLLKETALILLQTVPKDIELSKLKEELHKIKGILSVHELHVWKLSGTKIIATAHITCHNLQEYMQIAAQVKNLFHDKGIHSTTIQPEFIDPINDPKDDCLLECVTDCNANTCCGQSNQPNSVRLRSQMSNENANIASDRNSRNKSLNATNQVQDDIDVDSDNNNNKQDLSQISST